MISIAMAGVQPNHHEFFRGNEQVRRERIATLALSGMTGSQIIDLTGYKPTQVRLEYKLRQGQHYEISQILSILPLLL